MEVFLYLSQVAMQVVEKKKQKELKAKNTFFFDSKKYNILRFFL